MANFNVDGKLRLDSGSFISSANAASNSLNGLNSSATGASTSMKYLKRGALAAVAALGGLAAAGVKAASDYQQSMIAFEKMLGSAEKATTFVKELQDFAAATPFELPQVQAGAKKLMAFGFEAGQVLPMLTAIGDAASGLSLGSDGIDRLTLAIGQMQAKGKVSGGELRQLAEAGIPALQYLADAYGKTTQEILDMSEKGAIPASAGIGILIKGMEEGSANAMGFSGMMEAQSKTMAGLMSTLKDTVRNAFVDGFNKYVPAISGVFESMLPKVGAVVNKIISTLAWFLQSVGALAGGIATLLKPVFQNFLIPAFKILGAAIFVVMTLLAKLGNLIKANAGFFQTLVTVVGLAALAYGGLWVGVGIYNGVAAVAAARTKLLAMWTNRQAIATGFLSMMQLRLNVLMAMNPIGLIIAAVVILIGGFVALWNHSEGFRKVIISMAKAGIKAMGFLIEMVGKLATGYIKIVTGPMKMLLKGLKLLGIDAAGKALDGIESMTDGIGDFFDGAAKKVTDFAGKLDGLENKKIKLPTFSLPGSDKKDGKKGPKISDDQFNFNFDPNALGGDGKDGAAGAKKDLINTLKSYNDFINNDFAKGFLDGSEKAQDTILKGLDELKKVFDEQSKGLKGDALKKVQTAFNKVNDQVRGMMDDAKAVADNIQSLTQELEKAYDMLDDALKSRTEGANAIGKMFATPFGQPSDIQKAIASGESTVESVISMYDSMVDAVNKRYDGIDPAKRDSMVDMLTEQTAKLVALAKRREAASKALEEAQKSLDDVLEKQASFKSDVVGSIKSFGLALADLSKSNTDNTIKVIKTASGTLITQMSQSKSGVDSITDQLKKRLATIREFTSNIQALLAKGMNKQYVQQLLEAGPEAAGSTASLLASAGTDQVSTINELYGQINSASESFGSEMSKTFYGNAVSMAQAMVDGAKAEQAAIVAQMTSIKDSIEAALKPLSDVGKNIGDDLIQQMIDALERKKAAAIAQAQAIAAAMSAAMAAAMAGIGVQGGAVVSAPTAATPTPTPTPTPVPSTFKPYLTTTPTTPGTQGFIGPVLPSKPAPVVNVTINKNIEDAAIEGIMSRSILNAMRAK